MSISKQGPSYGELLALCSNPSAMITLKLITENTYPGWVSLIEQALEIIINEMSNNPQHYQNRTEDELTIGVVSNLRMQSFDADHDTQIGGHVDIKIRGRNGFLWLGEAKKHKDSYDWLYTGFQQLDTRYANPTNGQDRGGLIIYCFAPRIDRIMCRWQEKLKSERSDISIARCSLNPVAFISTHKHKRNGQPFRVRHIPVSLHFDPQDSYRK